MKYELITVTIDSKWSNESEVKAFTAKMKNKFHIMADFNDGGDHYSSWTLTGIKENLHAAILANWSEEVDNLIDMMTDTDYYKVFLSK